MVDGRDSIFVQFRSFGQVRTEDGVVGHVHEGNHGMPSLVVVPHLWRDCVLRIFLSRTSWYAVIQRVRETGPTLTLFGVSIYLRNVPTSFSICLEC